VGVGGLTGFGANIFGYDDPHDLQNVESDIKRNEVLLFATSAQSPTSALEPTGQDLGARQRSGLTTVPLQSRSNSSPFWIMLLLSSATLENGMIGAADSGFER
jgi:hypothetical protein